MKIIFALRKAAFFSYHKTTIEELAMRNHQITVVVPIGENHESDPALSEFMKKGQIRVEPLLNSRNWLMRNLSLELRELLSFLHYMHLKDQSPYYAERWRGYLRGYGSLFQIGWVQKLFCRSWFESVLQRIESWIPADRKIKKWLTRERPDIVMASPGNMKHSAEIEYVKAARSLGIKTLIPVHSWDNLTTKGLFHARPDYLLAWNEIHQGQAESVHGFPQERIKVTGAVLFDKWSAFGPSDIDQKNFYHKMGLNPEKPFVLYLGSSSNIAKDESWVVCELARALNDHEILVRPHPENRSHYRGIHTNNIRLWSDDEIFPSSYQSQLDFYSAMKLSKAVIGINTSGLIDAIVVDQPCITIVLEQYAKTQALAAHFRDLVKAQALYQCTDFSEIKKLVHDLEQGLDPRRKNRNFFVSTFIRPNGANDLAGVIAAKEIEKIGYGKIDK